MARASPRKPPKRGLSADPNPVPPLGVVADEAKRKNTQLGASCDAPRAPSIIF